MADLFNDGRTFNASEYESDPFFVTPGDYLAALVKCGWRESKSSPGVEYLACEFQILEGSETGKIVREILNLRHPKDDVRAIAERRLSELCKAVGVHSPRRTQELENIPFGLTVKEKKEVYNGESRIVSKAAQMVTAKAHAAKKQAAPPAGSTTQPGWMGRGN